jgi:hypothetical protein
LWHKEVQTDWVQFLNVMSRFMSQKNKLNMSSPEEQQQKKEVSDISAGDLLIWFQLFEKHIYFN